MHADKTTLKELILKWDELGLDRAQQKDLVVANGYVFKFNGELYDSFSLSQLVFLINNYKANSGEIPEY